MSTPVQLLIVVLIFSSHLMALARFWRRIRTRTLPSVADFACASLVLYYDIGLLLEVFGWYENSHFSPLLEADAGTLAWALTLLVAAPWLFRLGERLFRGRRVHAVPEDLSRLRPSRRVLFYPLISLAVAPLGILGLWWMSSGEAIWVLRARVGMALGPLMLVLYVPMYVLAFYVRQADSRTGWGRLYSTLLVGAGIMASCAYGQRTAVLLPLLILVLFGTRVSMGRVAAGALAGLVAASILLPLYKWQFAEQEFRTADLIAKTVTGDLARAGVLRRAIELSDDVGTQVMDYPFEGYVYAGLLFVPRSLVPSKGQSTARRFTAYLESTPVEETNWGFGLGALEETIVNGGLLMALPMLLMIGMAMGILQRASSAVPSIAVPTRLAALWSCGYHLPALILLFGGMLVVALLLDWAFVIRMPRARHPQTLTGDLPWNTLLAPRPGTS
ncbi:MAG: hypothetical protein QOK27_2193 [Gemmatimonadales bacterium]|jgi:hypothetical protein|nr:hypothetical protein [Gemmatimonadales bacterium]